MRIVLAEDHALVRAGIRALLATLPDVSVVAEAEDGREAVERVRDHRPDIVLMDIAMPRLNGLEAVRRIHEEFPKVKIVCLSMHANEEYVWQAFRLGAAGYLLKNARAVELRVALETVMRNQQYLSPAIASLSDYMRRVGAGSSPLERLTPRQREVMQLIAEGHTNREIAAILGISVKTVGTHRMQLMETLGIHDVASLVRYALRHGLIAPS